MFQHHLVITHLLQMATNYSNTPDIWLLSVTDYENFYSPEMLWPWPNVSVEEFCQLCGGMYSYQWRLTATQITGLVVCPLGVVGSLICCVLFAATRARQVNFCNNTMLLVAALDLVFNACFVLKSVGEDEQFWIGVLMPPLVYSVSLAADLCTLALNVERYLALCWPVQYRRFSAGTKRKLCIVSFSLVVAVSSTRCHIIIHQLVLQQTKMKAETQRFLMQLFYGLGYFSNMLMPGVMSVAMTLLNMRIIAVIVRQKHVKVQSNESCSAREHKSTKVDIIGGPAPQRRSTNEVKQAMISMILVLNFLFLTNQFGYGLFTVATLMDMFRPEIRFDSSKSDIRYWCKVQSLLYVTMYISDVLECLSHALSFFLNLIFAGSFRKSCREMFHMSKGRFKRACETLQTKLFQ